jgi:hypothetical protein
LPQAQPRGKPGLFEPLNEKEKEMNKYEVEWWYADGHGKQTVFADDEEQAAARFWKRFGRFLPMAYERTRVTLIAEREPA